MDPAHLDLVVLPDWHRPHAVLGAQLLGEGRRHQPPPADLFKQRRNICFSADLFKNSFRLPPDVGRSLKVSFAALRSVGSNVLVQFHVGI